MLSSSGSFYPKITPVPNPATARALDLLVRIDGSGSGLYNETCTYVFADIPS